MARQFKKTTVISIQPLDAKIRGPKFGPLIFHHGPHTLNSKHRTSQKLFFWGGRRPTSYTLQAPNGENKQPYKRNNHLSAPRQSSKVALNRRVRWQEKGPADGIDWLKPNAMWQMGSVAPKKACKDGSQGHQT